MRNSVKELEERKAELEADLLDITKGIEALKEELYLKDKATYQDKSIHIIDRFNLWVKSDTKIVSDRRIKDGPMLELIFSDLMKYEQIDLVDYITDWLWNVEEIETVEDFNNLFEDDKKAITSILEDAVDQNISEFKDDW